MALLKFLFPPSLFVTATCLATFTTMATAGLSEFRGNNVEYSKFFKVGSKASDAEKPNKLTLPSRIAMATLYTPAFLAGVSSFAIFPEENLRFLLLKSAISIHFFKRVIESCFVHKYSGEMGVETMMTILSSYFISSALMIFNQHLTMGFPEPAIDLKSPGIVLFLIGITGNFYHHLLLSKLRTLGSEFGEKEMVVEVAGIVLFLIGITGNFYHHLLLSKLRTQGPKQRIQDSEGGFVWNRGLPPLLVRGLSFLGICFHFPDSVFVCKCDGHYLLPAGEKSCHQEMVPFKV